MTDHELIKQYRLDGNEEAFTQLVNRHVDWVFSMAFRRTNHVENAKEITQSAFTLLARNASKFNGKQHVGGWLYHTCRNLCLERIRSDLRFREQKTMVTDPINASEKADPWGQIAPLLEPAMDELSPQDRRAILLRFFEGKSLRDIGRELEVTESTAQKRVARAVDKLRGILGSRGISMTSAGLSGILVTSTIKTAPLGLASAVIVKGLTAGSGTLTNLPLLHFMKMKATTGILSAMLVVGTTFSVVQMKELSEQQAAFRKLNASSQLVLQTNKELEEKLNALKATNEQLKKDLSDLHRLRNEATQAQHLAARIAKLEKENQRFNNLADASEVNAGEFQEQLLIDPDRGLGPIAFGMPMEDVKAQLGDPDIITGSVLHYQSRGFAILPNGKDNTVGAIMMGDTEGGILTQLFKGQTQKGIIMGASREEVIDAYGPPVTKQPREQQKMDPEVLRRFFGDQAPPPEALDVEAMEAARGYERLNYQDGNLTFLLKDGKLVHITVRQARSSF